MEQTHDPREFIRGLQQVLISDTKRIGFLCGAGTSMAANLTDANGKQVFGENNKRMPLIPGVEKMTEVIVGLITEEDFKNAINILKDELREAEQDETKKDKTFLIENIISAVDQKLRVIGNGELCGLKKARLKELRTFFLDKIKELISVHDSKNIKVDTSELLHSKFAKWIKYASRKNPAEIFTTNYDYLFELGFESQDLAYFDGFVGGYNPFFDPISVENDHLIPIWTRLWKLHGSLGWTYNEGEKRIIRSRHLQDDAIVIYPSLLKYDDSRKQPYLSYIDRLSDFVKKDDGVLFICGYSFGDDHLNETIMNALAQSRSSTVVALVFDDNLTEKTPAVRIGARSHKMIVCGNKQALIGGVLGEWKLKRDPGNSEFEFIDQFYDLDSPEPKKDKGKDDEEDRLTGEFRLTDFAEFVRFLNSLTYPTLAR